MLAARSAGPLEALRARLEAAGATAALSTAIVDRERPQTVVTLAPCAVIDAAGPATGVGDQLRLAAET